MLKRFFSVLLTAAMFTNLTVFAQFSDANGVYTEDFDGYQSGEEINQTIVKKPVNGMFELAEKGGSQVLKVASDTEASVWTNNNLYNKELNVIKFKIGADSAGSKNWNDASALVFKYTNDTGMDVDEPIFDFAYNLIRHKEGGVTEKGICSFSATKMYNVVVKTAKVFRNGDYFYDVTYTVDGSENTISFITNNDTDGKTCIGFKSKHGNAVYIDDIEVSGYTFTRASVNIQDRKDVSVIPEIEVSFTAPINESLIIPSEICVGETEALAMNDIGGNKYRITLSAPLTKDTEYTLDLSAIRDINGNSLEKSTFDFKTRNTSILLGGTDIVNISNTAKENILIVFPQYAMPIEIYPQEEIPMGSMSFFVVTPEYEPIAATTYAVNTDVKNDSFSAEFDSTAQKVKLSGKTAVGFSDELVAISVTDKNGNVVYTDMLKTGEKGYFSMEFAPTLPSDNYTIVAKTMEESFLSPIKIRTASDIEPVLSDVNTKNISNINNIFDDYVLLIDLDLYNSLSDKSLIATELAKTDGYTKIEKLVEDIEVLSLIATMKASQDMYGVFGSYKNLVIANTDAAYGIWDGLSAEKKAEVIKTVIDSGIYTPDKFKNEIYVQSIFKMIATTNKYIDVKNAIENHSALLGINLAEYNSIGQPSSVAKGLCEQKWDINTFAPKFNSLVNEAKAPATPTPAPPAAGGGGGGGGGGGTVDTVGNLAKPEAPPEPMNTPTPTIPPKEDTAVKFSDIEAAKWAEEAICSLYDSKIISGYDDGTFRPDVHITREEFVAIIVRYLGLDTGAECNFNDVSQNSWFYKSVAEAAANGIIRGISETEFGAGIMITRQDAAVILYNIGDFKGEGELGFTDKDIIAAYAKEAVSVLSDKGIISGISDGSFAPVSPLTRAQAAQLIYTYDIKKEAGK